MAKFSKKHTVEYAVNLTQDEAEGLLALIYHNCGYLEEGPFSGLYNGLQEVLDVDMENGPGGDNLENKYAKYI
jgi:hypothetical protein